MLKVKGPFWPNTTYIIMMQSFSIDLICFSFHLMESDVNSNSFYRRFFLINGYCIVINGFEMLLHKLGVNLKHNLKAIGKRFSANFVFESFPSSSLDKVHPFRR